MPNVSHVLQTSPEYHLLNNADVEYLDTPAGRWSLVKTPEGMWVSGFNATYGGIDWADDRVTPLAVWQAVLELPQHCAVRARPHYYAPDNETLLTYALLNAEFRVESCELAYYLATSRWVDAGQYWEGLKRPQRKAIQYHESTLFRECDAADVKAWRQCYDVIALNRAVKYRPLTYDFKYLSRLRLAFADRIRMFALGDPPVAAALIYEVSSVPRVWLVQWWGDYGHEYAPSLSPMAALVYRLVEAAISNGVVMVDVGESREDGLRQFKRSMAASVGLRINYVRDY